MGREGYLDGLEGDEIPLIAPHPGRGRCVLGDDHDAAVPAGAALEEALKRLTEPPAASSTSGWWRPSCTASRRARRAAAGRGDDRPLAAGAVGGLMRRALAAAVVAMAVAALPQVAAGLLVWTFVVVPLTVTAGQGTVFTMTATNVAGPDDLGCLEVTLPSSFAIGLVSDPVASNGDNWVATQSGTTVEVRSLSGGGRLNIGRVGHLSNHRDSLVRRDDVVAQPRSSPAGLQRPDGGRPAGSGGRAAAAARHPGTHATTHADPHAQADGAAQPNPVAAPSRCHRCPAWGRPPPPLPRHPRPRISPRPRPSSSATASPSPTATPLPGGAVASSTPGPGAAGGQPSSQAPRVAPDPGEISIGAGTLNVLDGISTWSVPAAVVGVPGLLVVLWVALQTVGALAWIPAVRRLRGDEDARRRPESR